MLLLWLTNIDMSSLNYKNNSYFYFLQDYNIETKT